MKFKVYVTKVVKVIHYAEFIIDADSKKSAKQEIMDRLSCTCLAESLRHDKDPEEKITFHSFAQEFDPDDDNSESIVVESHDFIKKETSV